MTQTEAEQKAMQSSRAPVLDVVIPVYNEEVDLGLCVRRLHSYLRAGFPFTARITIADNASTDATLAVAELLAAELDGVQVLHLDAKGRGRALRTAWEGSDAAVVAYMDVDLSTDLNALLPLIAPLVSGHSDLAIGTRLDSSSRVVRGPKREIISRCYNLLLKTTLRAGFSDAQCGFKAVRTEVARELLPLVRDGEWFFDTELLVLAERAGLRIHEVPVDWIDDPDSRVDIIDTARKDLRGIWRLTRALTTGALPVDELRAAVGREPLVAGVPLGMVGQLVRFAHCRGDLDARLHRSVSAVAAVGRQPGRQSGVAADHRGGQYRRQSGVHLRCARTRQRGVAPVPGLGHLRVRAGDHQRIAVRPAPLGSGRARRGGAHRADHRQSRCDACSFRGSALGVPARGRRRCHCHPGRRVGRAHERAGGAPMTTTIAPPSPTGIVNAEPNRKRWERPALAALLLGTLIAYLINLSANGWANDFYAAAIQAGSQSWEAFFFGSSDAANSITVDKPPASLWVMELSVRLFGLNSWSMLVPQVLLGVASVALLWATVRRSFGPAAGLLAGRPSR